jgi:hypothetical protein
MAKTHNARKNIKKRATHTMKERRLAKREKRASRF